MFEDRFQPGHHLEAGHYVGTVNADNAFRCPGGAAAHQQHRGIRRGQLDRRWPVSLVDQQQVCEVVVAGRQPDAVTVARLTQQREQYPQHRRKVVLDVGCDHAAQRRPLLDGLDPLIEPGQRDDGLDAVLAQRLFELAFRIERIQRRDDRPDFPRAILRDQELRTVWQQQCDPFAGFDAKRNECRCACVAQSFEASKRKGRALELNGRIVWTITRCVGQVIDQRAVGIRGKRCGNARVVMGQPRRRGRHQRRDYS